MDGDNARLNSLVAFSRSLADAKNPQAVAEASTPFARRIANASTAFVVRRTGPDKVLALYDSCGEHAAAIYGQYEDHFAELIEAAVRVSHPVIAENRDEAPGASLAVPLVRTKGSESVLVVCHLEPGTHFEPQQFDAVTTLAGLTAGALETSDLQDQQRNFFAHVTDMLVAALDSFVDGREGHAENVARIANRLGRELALDDEHLRRLHFAALLHDIGMLRVDRSGHADPKQYRKHSRNGHRMMSRIRLWENAAPSVLHHHEWYDGSGYPEGLADEKIPYHARIIAVADAFDAMMRPLGDGGGLSLEAALAEVLNGSGTQFDPEVAAAFERLVGSGEISAD
jgi:hypothetical protein